jgi:hypothetical protein
VPISEKFANSETITNRTPGIAFGNYWAEWGKASKEAIKRRLCLVMFKIFIVQKDTTLARKLMEEIPSFVLFANHAYLSCLRYCREHNIGDVDRIWHHYFNDAVAEWISGTDPGEDFFTYNEGEYFIHKDAYMPWLDLSTDIKNHTKRKQFKFEPDAQNMAAAFQKRGITFDPNKNISKTYPRYYIGTTQGKTLMKKSGKFVLVLTKSTNLPLMVIANTETSTRMPSTLPRQRTRTITRSLKMMIKKKKPRSRKCLLPAPGVALRSESSRKEPSSCCATCKTSVTSWVATSPMATLCAWSVSRMATERIRDAPTTPRTAMLLRTQRNNRKPFVIS